MVESRDILGIGSSDCRPMIEWAEGRGEEMWRDILKEELESLWTRYNVYERKRRMGKKV
jgi:hypothetical protein